MLPNEQAASLFQNVTTRAGTILALFRMTQSREIDNFQRNSRGPTRLAGMIQAVPGRRGPLAPNHNKRIAGLSEP